LKNLLSNAFKFTEEGSVRLKISSSLPSRKFSSDSLKAASQVIVFSVIDTGIGIPLEKQDLIFEAFQQADGTTSRKYGGTGLGLTISREITRLLGGMIEVESTPGSGSTFHLYLPAKYCSPEVGNLEIESLENNLIPPLPKNADFSGKKVLVVDDDIRNIFAISTVLESYEINVIYGENGKIGIKCLKDNPDVDVVLMDIMMPGMDGIEAIQEIRRISRFRSLPIISVTAKAMKGDREKCLEAGASDYITKPVDPEKLLSMIHFWLNHAAKKRLDN